MSASLALVTVVVSGVIYHLAQKTSDAARPWSMLSVAYGAAFALAVALDYATGAAPRAGGRLATGMTGLLIGLAAFGIEAGFFFVYRSGWPLSSASVVASVSITVVLAFLGVFGFGEGLSAARAAGLALAACGVILIARG